jgi:putative oxidoreductase
MKRLFSTFPDGWPGRGLLLLRIALAVPLLLAVTPSLSESHGAVGIPLRLTATADCAFLLLGLETPYAAALQAFIEGWLAFAHGPFNPYHLARSLAGLAFLMMGPGEYSLDRRFYGRKRIELGR